MLFFERLGLLLLPMCVCVCVQCDQNIRKERADWQREMDGLLHTLDKTTGDLRLARVCALMCAPTQMCV